MASSNENDGNITSLSESDSEDKNYEVSEDGLAKSSSEKKTRDTSSKRTRETTSSETVLGKRKRNKTNRLGVREGTDYNALISNLSANSETGGGSNESNSPENIVEEESENEILVIDDSSDSIAVEKTANSTSTKPKSTIAIHNLNHHDLLQLIYKKVDAIEDHLIKLYVEVDNIRNEAIPVSKKEIDSINTELLSQLGLPARSQADLDVLEESLKSDKEFKSKLIKITNTIGGNNGNADGSKVLESLIHALISPHYLPSISWTGRGKGNEKKVALSSYINIRDFLTFSVVRADNRYTAQKICKQLTYTILKRAPTKFGTSSTVESQSSNSSVIDNSQQQPTTVAAPPQHLPLTAPSHVQQPYRDAFEYINIQQPYIPIPHTQAPHANQYHYQWNGQSYFGSHPPEHNANYSIHKQ